jgi:hypothetical protein
MGERRRSRTQRSFKKPLFLLVDSFEAPAYLQSKPTPKPSLSPQWNTVKALCFPKRDLAFLNRLTFLTGSQQNVGYGVASHEMLTIYLVETFLKVSTGPFGGRFLLECTITLSVTVIRP